MAASPTRSRALSAALALLAAACDLRAPPEPEPPRAAPIASATAAATSTIAAPPGSGEASPAPRSDCALRLLPVEFRECNPKPSQRDYPECWTYAVDPGEEPASRRSL